MRSVNLPLPDGVHSGLRAEAERRKRPVTSLAREVLEQWLQTQARVSRDEAIRAFAAQYAGTSFDLSPDLESAGIEKLLELEQHPG